VKVAMYVYNDLRTDARVLREAAALAAAGHAVTVVARLDDPRRTPARERRDGFDIVRLPVPPGPHLAWTFLRYPWRARGPVKSRLRSALRRGAGGIGDLAPALAAAGATVVWSIVRAPFYWAGGAIRRAIGQPVTPGGDLVDWLVRWRWRTLGWARAASALVPEADVHHGHDLSGLPAAVWGMRSGARSVYDSHEIFLESGSNALRPSWVRRRFAAIEGAWIRRTSAVVTVNEAIAEELARRYVTPRIVAVHNCAPRWTPPDIPEDRIRRATGIPAEAPIALYHGGFSAHRGLEQLAEAILELGLEHVHAVYLGYGSQRGILERLASEPRFSGRIHVLGPVPPDEVVPWVAGADVDVMALQPSTLNHILSTPNKLFEALAAGTPVVASDFPELRRVLLEDPAGPLGELCDPADPRSVADAIRRVIGGPPADVASLRARCLAAAHERWNWETEAAKLVRLYDDLARTAVETR
jgi:glycosyltransferase involved in cell wall biosynthesis